MKKAVRPSFNDLVLAGEVRSLALEEIKKVLLSKNNKTFKQAVILRLAGTLLPRLNEVTGKDGKDLIPEPLLKNVIPNNDSIREDTETEKEN